MDEIETVQGSRIHTGKLTVGSLLGVPLGQATMRSEPTSATRPLPTPAAIAREIPTEEGPWTVVDGQLGPGRRGTVWGSDGVEALNYNNPFGQAVEAVWFDGKLVYALDLGEVDVDPQQVKVAQEYQLVYAVELDQDGKLKSEPERVPEQLNIYDSVPGMMQYSPIWQFNYVIVPRDYRANTLRSERDCLASGYPIYRSQVFEN
jgi:hypothetical protein